MTGTHLTGLEGTNPLGLFAALGVQVAFEGASEPPRLWWSDDVVPHAVVDQSCSVDEIADRAMKVFPAWRESPALSPGLEPAGDVKFKESDIAAYLRQSRNGGPGASLAACLVAEGSLANNGAAKPTDLHFTAGQQKFLMAATEILDGVTVEDLVIGLTEPWPYKSKLSSLMWDVADDANYALSSSDPSNTKKLTNPGPEALAILGISRYPVFGSSGRTLTQGASGGWKRGWFTWPIWTKPASHRAVSSLLAQAGRVQKDLLPASVRQGSPPCTISYADIVQTDLLPAWGITRVMRSLIRRSNRGRSGNFGPPEVIWYRE